MEKLTPGLTKIAGAIPEKAPELFSQMGARAGKLPGFGALQSSGETMDTTDPTALLMSMGGNAQEGPPLGMEAQAVPEAMQPTAPIGATAAPSEAPAAGGALPGRLAKYASAIPAWAQAAIAGGMGGGGGAPISPYIQALSRGTSPMTTAGIGVAANNGSPKARNQFESALEQGIMRIYSNLYMGQIGDPRVDQRAASYYNQLRDGIMASLTLPDGSIDLAKAGRVLFPNDEQQQAVFSDAIRKQMNIATNLPGVMKTANIFGGWQRMFDRDAASSWTAARNAVADMAGERATEALKDFDDYMGSLKNPDEKEAYAMSLLNKYNAQAAKLLRSTGVGK